MDFKLLKQLYKIHSKSGYEGKIITFVCKWVDKNIQDVKIELDWNTGNIYMTKGTSDTYPCMVAHLDQVQKYHPTDFTVIETKDLLFGYSPKERSFCGLGADDKNGIWLCLQCLQKFNEIKVAFFVGEEVGCVGSSKANMDFLNDCRFVIQPDRRGNTDVITHIGFMDICSDDFIRDITPEKFGYTPTEGMMTDVEQLKENGLNVSCINVSCGYYEPHTDNEFTDKNDLMKCLVFIEHIITSCNKVYPHEPGQMKGYDCQLVWWEQYEEMYELVRDSLISDPTLTLADLHSFYHEEYPLLGLDDFAMICDDAMAELYYERNEDVA